MTTRRKRVRNKKSRSVLASCSTKKREGKPNSKRQQRVGRMQQLPSLSDLPLDIIERIIGRLRLIDRIRIRAVCKSWSVLTRLIPTIDKFPWAMRFSWRPTYNGQIYGECKLIDPPLWRKHVAEEAVRGKECQIFLNATPCASSCGWLLFWGKFPRGRNLPLFMYCPFTREVIELPDSPGEVTYTRFDVATFSLDDTSPKCVIFSLQLLGHKNKICISICSPGDISCKTFEFIGFGYNIYKSAVHAAYAGGFFYCVFSGGELGAFNVELEEWTILNGEGQWLPGFDFKYAKLIVSDGDLLLMSRDNLESSKQLLKFDFSKMRWVYENSLNNRVLFIGCTSFSCPAGRETSGLANNVFACCSMHPKVRCYGTASNSRQYHNWLLTATFSMAWMELPVNGIWRANDLINAV